MKTLLVVLLLASAASCRSSRCAHYAEMEAKCASVNDKEREQAKTLARGMCEAAGNSDPAVAKAGERFAKEADCAADADDCVAYKQCVSAIK